jgi:threonine synthase
MTYLTHLECPQCSQTFSPDLVQTFCHKCHAPLLARYDLAKARGQLTRDEFSIRDPGMWRWHELLPAKDLNSVSSLGEGDTPLLPLISLSSKYNQLSLFAKDESQNPTASFKARGLSAAVSKANEIGLKQLVIPTAGNAGGALAAYASRVGITSAVVMPADTPPAIIHECKAYGAEAILVDGLISDCAKVVDEMISNGEWFSVSTFREPYRLEGKKIMGYELAESFRWRLPEAIIYPTGGGTGLVGMWKAFEELNSLGWLDDTLFPKMFSVQSAGCAPVVRAFLSGRDECEFWQDAETIASGIRVPLSLADKLILKIIRESHGSAVSVTDGEMVKAQGVLAKREGIFTSPEGAATLAALDKLIDAGSIQPNDRVVLFMTASGVKYI